MTERKEAQCVRWLAQPKSASRVQKSFGTEHNGVRTLSEARKSIYRRATTTVTKSKNWRRERKKNNAQIKIFDISKKKCFISVTSGRAERELVHGAQRIRSRKETQFFFAISTYKLKPLKRWIWICLQWTFSGNSLLGWFLRINHTNIAPIFLWRAWRKYWYNFHYFPFVCTLRLIDYPNRMKSILFYYYTCLTQKRGNIVNCHRHNNRLLLFNIFNYSIVFICGGWATSYLTYGSVLSHQNSGVHHARDVCIFSTIITLDGD